MKKFIHFPETPACPLTFTATSYQTNCWSFYLITTCWMANSETEESNGDKWSDNQQLNWFHRLQSIDSKFRCHPGTLQNSHSLAEQYSFCFLLQGALHSTIPAVVFLPWNTKQLPTISNMNLMLTVCLASVLLYTGNSLWYYHTHTHTHTPLHQYRNVFLIFPSTHFLYSRFLEGFFIQKQESWQFFILNVYLFVCLIRTL